MRRCLIAWGVVAGMVWMGACGPSARDAASTFTVSDSAGVEIAENGSIGSAPECRVSDPRVTIGDVSGRPEYELFRVFGARRLTDGRIVLVNQGSEELRFYDREGVYLRSAGREGRGPGEFSSAFYIWVTSGDTLWVGDNRPWKFHVFSPEGEWVRTVRPTPTNPGSPALVAVLHDGRTVMASRPTDGPLDFTTRREVTVVVRDAVGVPFDTLGVFDYGVWGRIGDAEPPLIIYPLFESAPQLDGYGAVVHAGHGERPEVVVYSGDPGPTPARLVRWDPGDRTIRSADIAAERSRLADRYSELDPAQRRQFLEPLLSEERPVADEFPAFNALVTNRAGGFWVQMYPRPGGPAGRRWLAFAPTGGLICSINLPVVEVLDVGEGYVLVKQESELGVEQVVLYEVQGPDTRS